MKLNTTKLSKILLGAFAIMLICSPQVSYSQRVLTLEETLQIALNESFAINNENFNLDRSTLFLNSQKKSQKTRIDLSFTSPNYYKGINSFPTDEGQVFFDDNSIQTSGQLDITQPVIMTNGTVTIRGRYFTLDQYTEGLSGPRKTQNWRDDFTINYTQPLFMPNRQRIDLNQAERGLENSKRAFERTQNQIYFAVLQKYYSLVESKRTLEIEAETVAQNETTYEQTMNKYRAGIMAEVDALQAEVERDKAKNDYKIQELNYKQLLDEFKIYIGLPLDENIDVTSEVQVDVISVSNEKAYQEAFARDAGLSNQERRILDNLDTVEETKAQRKINATLRLSYGLNESDDFNSSFKENLFKDFSQTNSAIVNLAVPVFDWGKHSLDVQRSLVQVQSAELNLENQKKELRRSIQDVLNKIENARERMELQAKSEALAEKSYAISEERYNIGEISSQDLFLDNNRLKNTKKTVLNSKIQYLLAIAELNQKTYWDFESNRAMSETLARYIK